MSRAWHRGSRAAGRRAYRAGLEPLDHCGDRLTEADAHRRDSVTRVAALELTQERRRDPRAGRSERVAERDPAPVRVHVVHPLLEPYVFRELEHNRRERLVHLDDAYLVPADTGPG